MKERNKDRNKERKEKIVYIQKQAKKPVVLPDKWFVKILINIAVTLLVGAIAYYVSFPALNFKSMELYLYLGFLCIVYAICALFTSRVKKEEEYAPFFAKQFKGSMYVIVGLLVVAIIGGISSAVIFRAKSYKDLINVEKGNFKTDVNEVDFSSVPMIDSASTEKLADRKLGELEDMISQFSVDNYYTQINYKNRPVRVTPLKYSDIIKWAINTKDGLPAYLIVDMVSQKVEVVRLKQGMRYSTSEHFNRNLLRHLRFNYPTYLFDTPSFEIDEQGKPYWVVPRVDKKIGLFGGKDIIGAVLVDAVSGDCKYYPVDKIKTEKELQWIDRVYSSDLLIEQYNFHGKLQKGFINSLIGQRGVKVTTEGYNYLALNDDVYLYTGVTSITDDQSIVGFVLINQRTKESNYYSIAGAKELSAQGSAEGVVQQYGYTATFPLLLNISGQPTYFMALKDSSNLVKQYAMVNVEQYQVVATGKSLADCSQNYADLLKDKGITVDVSKATEALEEEDKEDKKDILNVTGVVDDIRTAVIGGNSVYYIRLKDNPIYFSINAGSSEDVVILNKGDNVNITYKKDTRRIISAKSVKMS